MGQQGRLRNLHRTLRRNRWNSLPPTGKVCTLHYAVTAAPATRSWVGRVRVVGAADVIDALDAMAEVAASAVTFTGTATKRLPREPLRFSPATRASSRSRSP